MSLRVRYYYQSSVAVPAKLAPTDTGICVYSTYGEHHYSHDDYEVMSGLGQINPALMLVNDARIELLQQTLPNWIAPKGRMPNALTAISQIERSLPLIALSLVMTVAFAIGFVVYGIPMASDVIAERLPATTLSHLGDQAETMLLEQTGDTRLSSEQQAHYTQLYTTYIDPNGAGNIRYVAGNHFDANAFALPNGTLFITDELIDLAEHDHQVLAVLAHEHGHVVHKHSIRQALNLTGVSVLIVMISGDTSDLLTTLPVVMLGMSYSRRFEYEADDYAVQRFMQQGLDTTHLQTILLALADSKYDSDGPPPTPLGRLSRLFHTHPTMAERVARIDETIAHHHLLSNHTTP